MSYVEIASFLAKTHGEGVRLILPRSRKRPRFRLSALHSYKVTDGRNTPIQHKIQDRVFGVENVSTGELAAIFEDIIFTLPPHSPK